MNFVEQNKSLSNCREACQTINQALTDIEESIGWHFGTRDIKNTLSGAEDSIESGVPRQLFDFAIETNGLSDKDIPYNIEQEIEFETLDIESLGQELLDTWKSKASDYDKHEAAKAIHTHFTSNLNRSYSHSYDEKSDTYSIAVEAKKTKKNNTGYKLDYFGEVTLLNIMEALEIYKKDCPFDDLEELIANFDESHKFIVETLGYKLKSSSTLIAGKAVKLKVKFSGGLIEHMKQFVETYRGDKNHF